MNLGHAIGDFWLKFLLQSRLALFTHLKSRTQRLIDVRMKPLSWFSFIQPEL